MNPMMAYNMHANTSIHINSQQVHTSRFCVQMYLRKAVILRKAVSGTRFLAYQLIFLYTLKNAVFLTQFWVNYGQTRMLG